MQFEDGECVAGEELNWLFLTTSLHEEQPWCMHFQTLILISINRTQMDPSYTYIENTRLRRTLLLTWKCVYTVMYPFTTKAKCDDI
jgi:hypothetical protein